VPIRAWRLVGKAGSETVTSLTSWYIAVDFTIIGRIEDVETFAKGNGIRELSRLNRTYWSATP